MEDDDSLQFQGVFAAHLFSISQSEVIQIFARMFYAFSVRLYFH